MRTVQTRYRLRAAAGSGTPWGLIRFPFTAPPLPFDPSAAAADPYQLFAGLWQLSGHHQLYCWQSCSNSHPIISLDNRQQTPGLDFVSASLKWMRDDILDNADG